VLKMAEEPAFLANAVPPYEFRKLLTGG
jgi:hypothetical protein